MKDKKADDWYPFWIDKWLFGSTRIELQPDERSVFIDLLTLSRKDKGFIRANEGIPYLESQICGLLNIKPSLLKRTIEKCIKTGKIKKLDNGTYFLISTEKYALSNRHKRRLKEDIASDDADIVSGKADTKSREEKSREEKKRVNKTYRTLSEFDPHFEEFWTQYPKEGRLAKQEARTKFIALCRRGELEEFKKGCLGYGDFLKHKRNKENFDQTAMYAKTFLNGRWKEYVGFKYEAPL